MPRSQGHAPDDVALSVRNVRVQKKSRLILDGISLDVPRGSVYGLVGPSGCGKTTLIRSVIGRQRLSSGSINVLGQQAGSPALRPLTGYMPQSSAVYSDLSARENLQFFATVYGVPPIRVDEVLDLVELHEADRPVATFSGGQRQRVALACALLPAPPLLILDEPTVGLDPRLRNRLWTSFRRWADGGTTLVVSTHVMDEAAHTDRLAFMAGGRLLAEGTPDDLLERTGAADLEAAVLALSLEAEQEGRLAS